MTLYSRKHGWLRSVVECCFEAKLNSSFFWLLHFFETSEVVIVSLSNLKVSL